MAYPTKEKDVHSLKEFKWTYIDEKEPDEFMDMKLRADLENMLRIETVRLTNYQHFAANFLNPVTPFKRLLLQWQTGTGKTIGALSIAMRFIDKYKTSSTGNSSVFIVGFSKEVFKDELRKYPSFGYITREEVAQWKKYEGLARSNEDAKEKLSNLKAVVSKRMGDTTKSGFFSFHGYRSFADNIAPDGVLNHDKLDIFENSLLICDEIHNTYNSERPNNYGIAIQGILDNVPSCRAVFASATPLNNNPTEIVDLLNLLNVNDRVTKQELFNGDILKQNAHKRIEEMLYGKVSFVLDIDSSEYPKTIIQGEKMADIPLLKFIRCPMSDFHYRTYKEHYSGALRNEELSIMDFVLEDPDQMENDKLEQTGIFNTTNVYTKLANASSEYKRKYFTINENVISGPALHKEKLGKYSTKYVKLLDLLKENIIKNNGKSIIFNSAIQMSGVLFIEQVLLANGYITIDSAPMKDTI
jgi:hypothetical protein